MALGTWRDWRQNGREMWKSIREPATLAKVVAIGVGVLLVNARGREPWITAMPAVGISASALVINTATLRRQRRTRDSSK